MNDMGYVQAILLLSLLVLRRGMLKLARRDVPWHTDPVMLLTGAWSIQSLAYALPIFVNRENLEGRHVLFIVGSHLAFLAGVLLVPPRRTKDPGAPGAVQITLPMVWAIGLIGLAGDFFVAYDGLSTSSVTLLQRLSGEGLETIRLERFTSAAVARGGPFAVLEFLSSASTVYVCLLTAGVLHKLNLKPQQRAWLVTAAVVTVFFVIFNALFIMGGRFGVVLLLLGATMGAMMDPRKILARYLSRILGRAKGAAILLTIVSMMASVWFFATTFTKNRNGNTSPLVSLAQYHRASLTPEVLDVVAQHEDLQYLLLNFSYLTVPLTTLAYYYDMPDGQFPGPYWGQYNFSAPATFVMRRLGKVREQQTVADIRSSVTLYLRVMGFGDNVWPTMLRDLALDVGWSGVPFAMFLLGLGAELAMRAARDEDNFIGKVLGLLTGLLLVFSFAHSLLILEVFQKAFWLCFALLLYRRIFPFRQPKGTAPGSTKFRAVKPKSALL